MINDDFSKIAIEALTDEYSVEVSMQNRKISEINKEISRKKNDLDNLRRCIYTMVKETTTILKEDLIDGNCSSYLFFFH